MSNTHKQECKVKKKKKTNCHQNSDLKMKKWFKSEFMNLWIYQWEEHWKKKERNTGVPCGITNAVVNLAENSVFMCHSLQGDDWEKKYLGYLNNNCMCCMCSESSPVLSCFSRAAKVELELSFHPLCISLTYQPGNHYYMSHFSCFFGYFCLL